MFVHHDCDLVPKVYLFFSVSTPVEDSVVITKVYKDYVMSVGGRDIFVDFVGWYIMVEHS